MAVLRKEDITVIYCYDEGMIFSTKYRKSILDDAVLTPVLLGIQRVRMFGKDIISSSPIYLPQEVMAKQSRRKF